MGQRIEEKNYGEKSNASSVQQESGVQVMAGRPRVYRKKKFAMEAEDYATISVPLDASLRVLQTAPCSNAAPNPRLFPSRTSKPPRKLKCRPLRANIAKRRRPDEITLRRNRHIYDSLLLKPRVLRGTTSRHIDYTLRRKLPHPLCFLPPRIKLFTKTGTRRGSRGQQTETIYTESSFSTVSIEKIAAVPLTRSGFSSIHA